MTQTNNSHCLIGAVTLAQTVLGCLGFSVQKTYGVAIAVVLGYRFVVKWGLVEVLQWAPFSVLVKPDGQVGQCPSRT